MEDHGKEKGGSGEKREEDSKKEGRRTMGKRKEDFRKETSLKASVPAVSICAGQWAPGQAAQEEPGRLAHGALGNRRAPCCQSGASLHPSPTPWPQASSVGCFPIPSLGFGQREAGGTWQGGRKGGQPGQGLFSWILALEFLQSGCVPWPMLPSITIDIPFFSFLQTWAALVSSSGFCLGVSLHLIHFVKVSLLIPPQMT